MVPPRLHAQRARTVCPHDCPSTCALEMEVRDRHTIGTVRGASGGYTQGVICAKVARYAERVHHPDRLTTALLRTGPKGSGQFRAIGWYEALDRVADALHDTGGRHGPEAVWPYYYAGTMGLVQRDGINRLRHVMRYSRQHSTICVTICESGWNAGIGRSGGPDPREIAESELIVMSGGNPASTQVNVMTHVTRARKRGAPFVVIDPYRTPTAAAAADIHLAPQPGTDSALACAMMHVAFRDSYADRAYLAAHTDNPDRLEAHLATRTPAWAAAITGLTVAEIEHVAALYGRTPRSYIRLGYGFARGRNGAVAMHAVTCLPAVTGAWQHRGGGAFWNHRGSGLYHWDKTLIEGLDALDPSTRRMDMSRIGAVPTGDRAELGKGPPVHALLIQNTNPVVVAPNSRRVREGFLREDLFTCVHEQFMTETAQMADIVLPATMFLEHDDLYGSGGHTHLQIGPKLIDPPDGCRSNHEVIQGLASRLGAVHEGFYLTAMQLADRTLQSSGWPSADAVREAGGVDAAEDFERSHFLTGFGFPDGRFRFAPDWASVGPHSAGMPPLPDHWASIDAASTEYPYRLVTAPARSFLNTNFTETPGSLRREGRPTALMHPNDMASLGLANGDEARIGNRQGSVRLHVQAAPGQQRGVLVVESIWPDVAWAEGQGINVLTSDAPAAPNGGAVFHDTAVWVAVIEKVVG